MIDWKPSFDWGFEATLTHAAFRVRLWAWPSGADGQHWARVIVDGSGFDQRSSADSLEEAKQKAADLLRAYLDGDPKEQAFRAKLRAWVAPVAQGIEP